MRRRAEFGRVWAVGGAVAVSLLTVTACAPANGGAGAPGQQVAGRQVGAAQPDNANPDCTKAAKVAIVEKTSPGAGATYAFSPSRLTIARGGFLAITNKSDEVHPLTATPDAGIVTSVLDLRERQVIQFPDQGTFTLGSAATGHRNGLRVTVSGESGCGTPKPRVTITDGYAITPARLAVTATENFLVVNDSAAAHTVTCTPDPGGNRDNPRLDRGETLILAIDEPGRYTCASRQHPAAKVVVTVGR